MAQPSVWSSLEIVKLLVAATTPIVVVAAGYLINNRLRSLESAQWAQQKVVERRIVAYDQLARPLNQLFCFFAYLGAWKEIKPPMVVALKRTLDVDAHISAPLFDGGFLPVYNDFMNCCFATFGGWGVDARLRTLTDRRRQARGDRWDQTWDECFATPDDASSPADVREKYAAVMNYLGKAIGATQVDAHMLTSTKLPANYEAVPPRVTSRISPENEAEPRA